MSATHYETLGVSREASQEEIKSAYRRLARQYHPDVNPGNPDAEAKFKEISAANNVIGDPDKRKQYNLELDNPGMPPGGNVGGSHFDHIADFLNAQMRNSMRPQHNADIHQEVTVNIRDLLRPFQRQISIVRRLGCPTCKGKGGFSPSTCTKCGGLGGRTTFQGPMRIYEPCTACAGKGDVFKSKCTACEDGILFQDHRQNIDFPLGCAFRPLTIGGVGNQEKLDERAGDLVVRVIIKPDPNMEIDGKGNVHVEMSLDPVEAMLGCFKQVRALDGGELKVEIPRACKPKQALRLKTKGIPKGDGSFTDMYIHAVYKVPEKFSAEQEKALKEYLSTIA